MATLGRPTKYSEEIADKICELIATTSDGLKKIAESQSVTATTVYKWLQENKTFSDKYVRARDMQADLLADEIIEIANTPIQGIVETEKEWGIEIRRGDMLEHRKLQIDARKWKASKLAPKKYGDKIEVDTNVISTVKEIVINPVGEQLKG